jgi:hypothetical protein
MVVLLQLTGAVVLAVGVWLKVDPDNVRYFEVLTIDQNDPLWKSANIILIAVGAFVFVVGFVGCCGACKESPCLLWLVRSFNTKPFLDHKFRFSRLQYIAFLFIIFIAEISAAVLAAVFERDVSLFCISNFIEFIMHNCS